MPNVIRVALRMSPFSGYERGVLSGIARYARLQGKWVLCLSGVQPDVPLPEMEGLSDSNAVPNRCCKSSMPSRSFLDFRRLGAVGFIGRIQTPADAQAILAAGVPAIAMDLSEQQRAPESPLSRLSEIRTDSDSAGQMAADHLLDRGFRHFAFCGSHGPMWSNEREAAFRRRVRERGFTCDTYPSRVSKRAESWTRERPRMIAWLSSLPKPVGVMTCNDIYGLRVIEACTVGDLAVPDSVAVVGVDDDLVLCALSNPPLSSVLLNGELAGYQAAELLDQMIVGQLVERRTILAPPLWVVPRRSTEILAVEDRQVARAMQFIRDNVERSINVADVSREMAVSRRALEIHFQRVLGRSIHAEIQRERLSKTKQLLVETDIPIWRIVEMVGFSNTSYASKVFHREVGVTLGSYRRRSRAAQMAFSVPGRR